MHLAQWTKTNPERIALIFAERDLEISYAELDAASNRVAHALRAWGIEKGDGVAVLLKNEPAFFAIYWGVMRAGCYFTPVNWHLAASEVAYIVENSDSKALFASADLAALVPESEGSLLARVSVAGAIPGFVSYEDEMAAQSASPIADESEGAAMLYSSGTTGRPKGVRPSLPGTPLGEGPAAATTGAFQMFFGMQEGDRYLCPGPLYHAAPLQFSAIQHRIGSTVVVMEKFTPENALRFIEKFRVTTSQWVPTHFNRMLSLPEDERAKFDVSSLRVALHAAAPCPIPVKKRMIDWWGLIILEYYAGTEGGGTVIGATDWLAHEGSVGRHWAGGVVHILDENYQPITEPNVDGMVYFDAPADPEERFRYHKDEAKTAESYNEGRYTLGDIGHLDADGFLYLTDRQSHMIISGGVNIYPQEIENCLGEHPAVEDVAVIGVPHDDMGEAVKAIVQLRAGHQAGDALAGEMIEWVRDRIAHYKAPRSVVFCDTLPRQENGKIYKRLLRDEFSAGA
jgi:acyl-coenzyme A synthetase/AMP-(fatty) acid ligase